jgi:hypothetical protein
MNKNFTAFALFLLLFGAIPVSCDIFCRGSCGCGPIQPSPDFSIKNMKISDFSIGQTFSPTVFYPKEDLFKLIEVSDYEYLSEIEQSGRDIQFIQAAIACSPAPNESVESITQIQITAKTQIPLSLEDTIEIGSNISDYFLVSIYPSSPGISIPNYLNEKPTIYLGEGLFLRWSSSLVENHELVFDIKINLSDGKVFTFEDEKMKLLK